MSGDSGTFSCVISELTEPIEVVTEIMLLMGPFQGLPGQPYVALSDFPLIYNWKLWGVGGGYWCPISWGKTTQQISPKK